MSIAGPGPIAVLRVAALPVEVLADLPGPALVAAIASSAAARCRVQDLAQDLVHACEVALRGAPPAHRALLLDLARRARRCLPLTNSLRLRVDGTGCELAPVTGNAKAYDEAWQAADAAARCVSTEVEAADGTLERHLIHQLSSDLGAGIALANDELHRLLVGALGDSGGTTTSAKRLRARLATAGRVLDRATLRTTPFPGLAGIALVAMSADPSGAPNAITPAPRVRGYALAEDLSRRPRAEQGLVQLSPLADRTGEGYLFPRWAEGSQEWVRIPPKDADRVDELLAAASITQRPTDSATIPAIHRGAAAFLREAGLLVPVTRYDTDRRRIAPLAETRGDPSGLIGDMVMDTDIRAAKGLARRAAEVVEYASSFLFSLPTPPGAAAIRGAALNIVARLGEVTLSRLLALMLREDGLIHSLDDPPRPPAWLAGELGSALARTGEGERRVAADAFGPDHSGGPPDLSRSLAALVMEVTPGRFVLNKVLPGGLRQVARYLDSWGDPEIVAAGRQWIHTRLGGREPVQIQPILDRNYQLTPLLGTRRLAVPGELVGSRDERLELDDVLVSVGGDGSLALVDRGGRVIGLVYAGCVREPALPIPVRMLCALADSWPDEVADRYSAFYDVFDRSRAASGRVGQYWRPRVVCGPLVLQRERYVLPGSALPRTVDMGADDAAVVRFDRWRRELGLPRRVFAKVLTPSAGPVRPAMFVDWTRPDILRSLGQGLGGRLDRTRTVVLEEALPDLAGTEPRPGQHATEVLVEVGR